VKKLVVLATCLLLFSHIAVAKGKYNSSIHFEKDNKVIEKIKVDKNKKFSINVVFQSDEFDMYGLSGILKYDKDKIELVECEGLNNFTVVQAKKILAYRIDLDDAKEVKVLKLTFKAKSSGKIEFINPRVADTEEEFEIESIKIDVLVNNWYNYCWLLIIPVTIVGVMCVYRKVRKK